MKRDKAHLYREVQADIAILGYDVVGVLSVFFSVLSVSSVVKNKYASIAIAFCLSTESTEKNTERVQNFL
jgi:hypothetical protein